MSLRGGVLLVERAYARQVALGFESLCTRLVELRAGLLGACAVYLGVDYEERLTLLYIGALLEEHLLEVALDTGTDFDELRPTYSP